MRRENFSVKHTTDEKSSTFVGPALLIAVVVSVCCFSGISIDSFASFTGLIV